MLKNKKLVQFVCFCTLFFISQYALAAPALTKDNQPSDDGVIQQLSANNFSPNEIVIAAMSFLGLPYKRGGTSSETGYDCSGFVQALFEKSIGKLLPRRAHEQAQQTTEISKSELQPGDLVFFHTMKQAFSHVGIYIGSGKFIHSPKPGSYIRIEDMYMPYWVNKYDGARRVVTN